MADVTTHAMLDAAMGHHRAGRLREAEVGYRAVLAREPGDAGAWHMLGIACHQAGRSAEGAGYIRRAIELDPGRAGYYVNLGNVLQATGDARGAAGCYREATARQPGMADAWNNLGNALQETGQIPEAIEAHRRAISLKPDFAQAWYGLGGAYTKADDPDAAVAAYERAVALKPDYAAAEVNRANLLRHVGRLDEAVEALRRVVATRATPVALSNLIYSMYFHPAYDTRQIGAYAKRWGELFAEPLTPVTAAHANDRDAGRRIRVGYVSPDFNNHPAGRFAWPLLSHHDHARVEVFCYSDAGEGDALTPKLRACADVWRETRGVSDEQLAAQVRADRIDVLVDLTLHLAGNRLLTFAHQPAPVQVTWLGYPGTSGLRAMDYRLSDRYLDPPSTGSGQGPGMHEGMYAEQTILLPDCYWCYDPLSEPIEIAELPAARNGFVTFGCLNNFAKVTGPTIELWARVLGRAPGSRLIVLAPPGSARERFLADMRGRGVESARVEFVGRMPRGRYMEVYRRIDVSLDTFPCNGHTTSFDSLWMGVPVVSLAGETAMSRGGLSILSNLGMEAWVTTDGAQYVEIAAKWASAPDQLAAVRAGLRGRMEGSALMDGARFARSIEESYRRVWAKWCGVPSDTGS